MRQLLKFFELDYRSLQFYRIIFALILFFDIFQKFTNAEIFYSQSGVYPLQENNSWMYQYFHSFFTWSHNLTIIKLQFLISLFLSLLLATGRYSKIVSILLWFVYNSLVLRNGIIIHSAEHIIRVLCFWNIFLPLNKQNNEKVSISEPFYLFQVLIIYLTLMLQRDYVAWVETGVALVWAFNSHIIISSIGRFLSDSYAFLESLSPISYWFEFIIPPLVLIKPLRFLIVPLMMLFHFSIFLFFDLGTFPFIGICLWIPFIPSRFWNIVQEYTKLIFIYTPKKVFIKHHYLTMIALPILIIGFSHAFSSFLYTRVISLPKFYTFYRESYFGKTERLLGVKQQWGMFTPTPKIMNGWHNIEVKLRNNDEKTFDLVTMDEYDRLRLSYFDLSHRLFLWEISFNKTYEDLKNKYLDFYCRKNENAQWMKLNYSFEDREKSKKVWSTKTIAQINCQKSQD